MKRKSKNVENNVAGVGGAATTCAVNQSRKEFMVGDIVWVKIRRSSWWPGQVVDENSRVGAKKTMTKMDGDILTRLYGSYDYMYVDPLKYQSEFENVLKRHNFSIKEILQKALEQGSNKKHASRKRSKRDPSADVAEKPKENGDEKNHKASTKQDRTASDSVVRGPLQHSRTSTRKAQGTKITSSCRQVDCLLNSSQGAITRRMRVMRNLGLVAPCGSPFLRKSLRKKGR